MPDLASESTPAPQQLDAKHVKPRRKLFFAAFFMLMFAFYAFFAQGMPTGSDSEAYFATAKAIVDRGGIAVDYDPNVFMRKGAGGAYYTKYGIGLSLVEVPFYWMSGRVQTKSPVQGYNYAYSYFFSVLALPAVTALTLVIFMLVLIALGYAPGVSLCATMTLGLATLMWPYSHYGFSEPLQACCYTGAFLYTFKARRDKRAASAVAGGIFFGMLLLTKFVNIAAAPFFLLYLFTADVKGAGRKSALAGMFLAPVAIAVAAYLCHNMARFGAWLDFGYPGFLGEDAINPLYGLYGLFFSSGKSIFLYMPVLVFVLFGVSMFHVKHSAESALAWGCVAVVALAHGATVYWDGSSCWGPRYLVPVVPLMMLPLAALFANFRRITPFGKGAAVFLIALSVFIQVLGVSINEYGFEAKVPESTFSVPEAKSTNWYNTRYVPEFSPIIGHYWMFKHLVLLGGGLPVGELRNEMRKDFPWRRLTSPAKPEYPEMDLNFDFWWYYFSKFGEDSAGRVRRDMAALAAIAAMGLAGAVFTWKKAFAGL